MTARIEDIINIMEKIAPVNLKESYDNVGFMVGDKDAKVDKVLIALDCTLDVIEEAKNLGAQLILTHHPLLFIKPKTITTDTLQGKKIISLIKNNIGLYSSHTNLDSVGGGLNDTFVKLLGFNSGEIIDKSPNCDKIGIGRMVDFKEEKNLEEIVKLIKDKLNLKSLRFSGNLDKKVRRIALINGSGQDYMQKSYEMGADLVITGDTTYHFVSDYTEMGLAIIDVGHFGSEWPALMAVSKLLEIAIEAKAVEIVISKATKDPYNLG
ncbi:MAG: Nif3-like dinuclear metal center hexameric protein [Clostridium sp.]|uniref:Nif3-like dinuclear metal center hexameric protein n=1 Tax=Clostridium sp. TaxID=1506 RepID=UPI003021ABBA